MEWPQVNRCDFRAGAQCSEAQVDLTFVVDTSSALGQGSQTFQQMRQFLVDIVNNLPAQFDTTRVGLVTIADSAINRFYLNTYTTRDQVRRPAEPRFAPGGIVTRGVPVQIHVSQIRRSSNGCVS